MFYLIYIAQKKTEIMQNQQNKNKYTRCTLLNKYSNRWSDWTTGAPKFIPEGQDLIVATQKDMIPPVFIKLLFKKILF